MDIQQLINNMTKETYQQLCYAVETGKWQQGGKLTPEQRDNALQVIMLYQAKFNTKPQHMTIAVGGDVKIKSKQELKQEFAADSHIIIQQKIES